MHEYSLISSLMVEVERQARLHDSTAVRAVHVRIGELAGVDPELFRTAFERIRPSTLCAGAGLHLLIEPAEWQCPRCDQRCLPGGALRCPRCGGPLRALGGRDLVLERLDLEVSHV